MVRRGRRAAQRVFVTRVLKCAANVLKPALVLLTKVKLCRIWGPVKIYQSMHLKIKSSGC